MEKKKMKIPRNILCRLCLECCVDGRPLDGFAGYQLHFVLPTIDLGLTSDPHMCRKCCSDIMVHYQFKVKCLDRNEPIYNFMELELLTKNCDNVNNKEKRDKCILCCTKDMNLRQLGGHQEKLLKLMLKLCLPDLDHTLSTICGDCLKCLINVFAFTNACVRTEKKIISYRNRYGVKEPNKVHLRHVVRFTDSGKDGGNIEKETENKKKSFSVASKSDTQLNELNSKARCTDGARCDTNDQNGRSKVNVNDKLQVSLGFKERARRVTDTSTESDNQTPSDGSIKSASCDEIDIDESSEEIEIEMKPEQDIDIKDEPLRYGRKYLNKIHLRDVLLFTDGGKDGYILEHETENMKKSFDVASKSDTQLNKLNAEGICTNGTLCDTNYQNGRSKVNMDDKLQHSLGYGIKEPNKVHLRHVVRFTDSGKRIIEYRTENKTKSFDVATKSDTQLNELNAQGRRTDGACCDTNDQNGRSKVNLDDQFSQGFRKRKRRVTNTSTASDNQTPSDASAKSESSDELHIDESSEEIEIEMKPEPDIDIKEEPLSFSKDFKNDSNAVDESSPHPEEIIDLCSVPEPKQNNNYNVAVKYYSCDACSYVSKYDSRLVRHKKLYHKKGPTSSGGPSEHGPKRYFIVDEPEEMPKFVCTSCDFTTEYVANIKVHIGSHEFENICLVRNNRHCQYRKPKQDPICLRGSDQICKGPIKKYFERPMLKRRSTVDTPS